MKKETGEKKIQFMDQQMDELILVNAEHEMKEVSEECLNLVQTVNSLGNSVRAEKKTYEAYLELKEDLKKDGIEIDIDNGYRSKEEQQRIWDEFTELYGLSYTRRYVARPGYSEHHTGLALDLYLLISGREVYWNEEMMEYLLLWQKIHAKLASHGFILRMPEGKADITGYSYEPWHIRYVGKENAEKMKERNLTMEEYLENPLSTAARVDYGTSEIYDKEDMDEAIHILKIQFESWKGCVLHVIRYAGDECDSRENRRWINELKEGKDYTHCIEFLTDFHSPVMEEDLAGTAWAKDQEYQNYQWWLGREDCGKWELVSWGY